MNIFLFLFLDKKKTLLLINIAKNGEYFNKLVMLVWRIECGKHILIMYKFMVNYVITYFNSIIKWNVFHCFTYAFM